MSIFTKDTVKVSDSLREAVKQVAEAGIETDVKDPLLEDADDIHVPGYGVLSKERAKREAEVSRDLAGTFAARGNHSHAAYHYERAAMLHKALHNHASAVTKEDVQPAVTEDVKQFPKYKKGEHIEFKASNGQVRRGHVVISTGEQNNVARVHDELGQQHWVHASNVTKRLSEESKEPELGRVAAKYARQKSRDNKQKDKEKQEKSEGKWQ